MKHLCFSDVEVIPAKSFYKPRSTEIVKTYTLMYIFVLVCFSFMKANLKFISDLLVSKKRSFRVKDIIFDMFDNVNKT